MTVTAINYDCPVGRWEPNARGRLEQAALELYRARGFESTTVADIAARAGLTERTFFRHYSDKREVLFAGSADLQKLLVGGIDEAPASAAPLDAIAKALGPVGEMLQARRPQARQRQAVIVANRELQERELIKLATLAVAVAEALRRRGVDEPAASLAAEAGIAVFKIGFERWIDDDSGKTLSKHISESMDELKRVSSARRATRSAR
jgi:AcrR family transcriptional regulator